MIDMIPGNTAVDLRRWCAGADRSGSPASGWWPPIWPSPTAVDCPHTLDHARRVADPLHVVRVGNRCLDTVRRRVQNEQLGHRGRKRDPLYKIRKILLAGAEHLNDNGVQRFELGLHAGDPNDEVLGAWLAKEGIRDALNATSLADATLLLDKTITGYAKDPAYLRREPSSLRRVFACLTRYQRPTLRRKSRSGTVARTRGQRLPCDQSCIGSGSASGKTSLSSPATPVSNPILCSPAPRSKCSSTAAFGTVAPSISGSPDRPGVLASQDRGEPN